MGLGNPVYVSLPLRLLTWYLAGIYFLWFVMTIVLTGIADSSQPFPPNGGNLPVAEGTLATINESQFYQFGSEGCFAFFMVFACWLAEYRETRQQRALALVATIWGVFSWFIYCKFTFYALDPGFNCGSLLASAPGVFASDRWCGTSIAAGVLSVLFELGKCGLCLWAMTKFFTRRLVEPFSEYDKSEIEAEQLKRNTISNQGNLAPIQGQTLRGQNVPGQTIGTSGAITAPSAVGVDAPIHVRSTPVGLIESDVLPGQAGRVSLADQRLGLPNEIVLFFIGLTIAGYIITTLSFIQLYRWDNRITDSPVIGGLGDLNLEFNLFFVAFTLLFSLSFGAMFAYDRVRDNSVSPIFLNVLTAMQLCGLVVYSLRRADIRPADGTTSSEWDSQLAQAGGFAIMAFSELLRIGAMIYQATRTTSVMNPNKPIAATALGPTKIMYSITQALMLVTSVTWLILLIINCAQPSLFSSGGATFATGVASPQASLQWAYHNFLVTTMIMAVFFAANYYISIAGTRAAALGGVVAQVFLIGTWWLTVWNPTYNMLGSFGFLESTFCTTGTTNLCNLVKAQGVVSMIFFATFCVNAIISLMRLVDVGRAALSALPAADVTERGADIVRTEALAKGTLGYRDTWWMGEGALWLSMAGWYVYAFGATDFNKTAYYTISDGGASNSLAFEIYQLEAVHFLSVAGVLTLFLQSQIVTNKTYRLNSTGFRKAVWYALGFQMALTIPMVCFMARYINNYSFSGSRLAAFSGLVIFLAGQVIQAIQFLVYFIANPVTLLTEELPAGQLTAYNKTGVPLDVEKGETLAPHLEQAGLGTNYAKNQPLGVSREKDSLNRDQLGRVEDPTDVGMGRTMERDTNIRTVGAV